MSKIDIIIPAYKAQKTISKALASILIQSIVNDTRTIIINDADGVGYAEEIANFSDKMDIVEITMPVNGGCGAARQAGIDFGNSPYIVFLDADDTFYHPFALETLLMTILSRPASAFGVGNFVEVVINDGMSRFIKHVEDFVWMFAKIYNREYLEKYNVRFSNTSANEDNGFNTILQMAMLIEGESVPTVDDIIYTWNFNENSITRINNYEYTYNQSVLGYAQNMIYAIDHIEKYYPDNIKTYMKIIEVMVNLYVMYERTLEFRPEFAIQNFECCQEFYNKKFKLVIDRLEFDSLKSQLILRVGNKKTMLDGFIPQYTIYQFLDKLEGIG